MGSLRSSSVLDRERPLPRADLALYGIYEISKILCGPGSLHEVLSGTLQVLHSFLDMAHGVIAVLDSSGEPEMVVSASLDPAGARQYFDALPEKVVGQIVVTEMPVVVENVTRDPAFAECNFGLWGEGQNVAFIGVPIRDRNRVIGAMAIDRPWANPADMRTDEDVRFLKMAANLIGQTVRLHRLVMRDRERMQDEQRRLEKERESLAAQLRRPGSSPIIGDSEALRAVLEKVQLVARSASPVLLRGESGTGKELFAQALHEGSPRHSGPFIKLNCAALPESVLESELFGHEKGSFTGALAQRKGRFELADGGTLFLDEIGEISGAFQAKLLRVLQEGEFERVGGTRTLKVNVRMVSATNRNLEEAVTKGTFRADLYYRLSVVPIHLPPLRERRADIFPLAEQFLAASGKRLAPEAAARLLGHAWPGNVRELRNATERAATLSRHAVITAEDLDFLVGEAAREDFLAGDLPTAVTRLETAMIRRALAAAGGNRTEAARRLNIHRQLLYEKMRRYGVEASEFRTEGVGKGDDADGDAD